MKYDEELCPEFGYETEFESIAEEFFCFWAKWLFYCIVKMLFVFSNART